MIMSRRGVDGRALSMYLSALQRDAAYLASIYDDARIVPGPQGRSIWTSKEVNLAPTGCMPFGFDHALRVMVYAEDDSGKHLPAFLRMAVFTDPWFFVVGVETERAPYLRIEPWQDAMRKAGIPDAFIAKITPDVEKAIKHYDRDHR